MEEKAYDWILKHLHSMKSKLPILDTFFFYDNVFHSRYYTGINNQIARAPQSGFKSLQDCIRDSYEQYKKSSELVVQSPLIGFLITHNKRRPIDIHNYAEILKDPNMKVPYLQLLPQSSNLPLKEITFSLCYTSNGYLSSVKEAGQSSQHRVFNKARDFMNAIIRTLEFSSNKRVVQLEVDLFENTDGTLWLGRSIHCRVIKQEELSSYHIASPLDLNLIKRKTNPCLNRKTSYRKEKARNFTIKNRLEPVKILSPDISDQENSISKPEETKKRNTAYGTNQETISKHFLEMVCKTNVAEKRKDHPELSKYETEEEYGRILKLINSRCSLEEEDSDTTPFSNDLILKREAIKTITFPIPVISRNHKTPEEASHAVIKPMNSTANNYRRHKARVKPKIPLWQERKAHLIYKELKKAKVMPFLSKIYPKKQKPCFKPIRLVKSEKSLSSKPEA